LSSDLATIKDADSFKEIVSYLPEHKEMLDVVEKGLPEVVRASSLFGKTQSQFMDNMLTVSKTTPIRNLRQILAEMNKTREALQMAYFNCKKKEIEVKMKVRDSRAEQDELKASLLEVEADEISSQIETSKGYISGAIRKLTNYQVQYDSIMAGLGAESFNEVDFEEEEEKYHIKTAFEQGLNSARSRGGMIDEGNLIYLSQIGINGTVAQRLVSNYLNSEIDLIKNGSEPAYQMQLDFLNQMSVRFNGCSRSLAEHKGMTGKVSEVAALKSGDTRLLGNISGGERNG